MTTTCRDFEMSISLRAAGALDPAETARLDAHLDACAACRAEADLAAEALSLAKLPPVSDAERLAMRDLPALALAEIRRSERRRGVGKRVFTVVAVAAAAALFALAPAVLRKPTTPPTATQVAQATWQEPDLDTVWADAQVVDFDSSAQDTDGTDAALAAVDNN